MAAKNYQEEAVRDKWGLFSSYMRRFWFEEKDHIADESIFYGSDEKVKPNTLELVKKFLREVRETRGYGVDTCPPLKFNSPFMPVPLDLIRNHTAESARSYYAIVVRAADLAVLKISADTGRNYRVVEIEKAVGTRCFLFFLTLTAKEAVADAPVQTFQSAVYVAPGGVGPNIVEEWSFKPSTDDAATTLGRA